MVPRLVFLIMMLEKGMGIRLSLLTTTPENWTRSSGISRLDWATAVFVPSVKSNRAKMAGKPYFLGIVG